MFQVIDKTLEQGVTVRLIQVPIEDNVKELVSFKWRNPKEGEFLDFSVKCLL